MKKLLLMISLVLAVVIVTNASTPNGINYQTVVRTSDGTPITDQNVSFRISILQNSASGTSVYTETHSVTTSSLGLVNFIIGQGSTSNDFSTINWSAGNYFVKVELDETNGSNFVTMGTSQLLSVPYAKFAETSDNCINCVTESELNELIQTENLVLLTNSGKKFSISVADNGTIITNEIIKDIDGNSYRTVRIGTQTWMAENLKTTRYKNGEKIVNFVVKMSDLEPGNEWQKVQNKDDWNNITDGATTIIPDKNSTYLNTYGRLYNWMVTTDSRNVCPSGWHIPTSSEWDLLIDYVDSTKKLKEIGTTHWKSPNNGTNESGFTSVPGGRFPILQYPEVQVGTSSSFWSKTEINDVNSYGYTISNNTNIIKGTDNKKQGFSIRCVKD